MVKQLAAFTLLFFAVGCATDVRTFSISVKNDTATNITLNLAKDVPQSEPLWASPEDIQEVRVLYTPETEIGVTTVPPGKTGKVHNVSGHFPDDVHAILRVYRGKNLLMRELLAMNPGPDRQDITLTPGDNRFVVHDDSGKLHITVAK